MSKMIAARHTSNCLLSSCRSATPSSSSLVWSSHLSLLLSISLLLPTMKRFVVLLFVVSCLLCINTSVVAAKKKKARPYQYDTSNYVNICPGHTIQGGKAHKTLQFLLQTSGATILKNRESAQHKAACWILTKDKKSKNKKHLSQRYALAVLYYMTQGDTEWNERENWLTPNKSECSWLGIQCNLWGTIVALDLGFNNLTGLFPRELKLLTALNDVDLHGNEIQGVIPNSVLEAWTGVVYLRLHMNGLFGQLPREIGAMHSLKELHLFGNQLQGSIPTELSNLSKLGKKIYIVHGAWCDVHCLSCKLAHTRSLVLTQRPLTFTPTTLQDQSRRYLEISRTCVSLHLTGSVLSCLAVYISCAHGSRTHSLAEGVYRGTGCPRQ